MRLIFTLLLALLGTPSWAMGPHGEITNVSELAPLPAYCTGTILTSAVSHDPKPISEYISIYGPAYNHLHHYCWALNAENHLNELNEDARENALGPILANIDYVVRQAPLTFSLLPEIYITKARILFKMHRDTDAIDILIKLTEIKPDYALAYAQLGKYYAHANDKVSAIRYYEQGLISTNKKNADFFIFQIKKLDNDYKIPSVRTPSANDNSGHEDIKDQAVEHSDALPNTPDQSLTQEKPASPMTHSDATQNPQSAQKTRPNPYCRFCP